MQQQARQALAGNRTAWPEPVRAAANQITYFEQQSQMRCLQHAYNNLFGGWHLVLPGSEAKAGADFDIISDLTSSQVVPMLRLVLDADQLQALVPELVAHIDRMIIFDGNVNNGQGHYQALRRIDGHHFLLDSLREGPQWLSNPAQFFQQIQHSTGGLMAAIPQDSSPVILHHIDFLSRQINQDIARALGDLYGTQPIAGLSNYLATRGSTAPNAEDLVGYFHQLGTEAGALSGVAVTGDRLFLLTRTAPYLIPTFFDAGSGTWQARVPAEGAGRMETRPLQAVLNAQQANYDQQFAQAATEQRRQEIASERQQVATIWLGSWPPGWPPRPTPAASAASSVQARHGMPDAEPPPSARNRATAGRKRKTNPLQTQYRAAQEEKSKQAATGARAENTSLLLQYASDQALQRVAVLARALGMTTQTIDTWLDGMCKQGFITRYTPELVASKKVVLATCLQLMVNEGRGDAARTLLAAKPPVTVQTLLAELPVQAAALRSKITDKEWQVIEEKSKGYSLMALMALSAELTAYDPAALVRCAKSTHTYLELVALTNVADSHISSISPADRISIAAHSGGWKNLEAAVDYLKWLTNERTTLEANVLAQGRPLAQKEIEQEIDRALAPYTIAMDDMVRIVSHGGGSKNLQAAIAYLDKMSTERTTLEANALKQGKRLTQKEIDDALAPYTIAMEDMVGILSHGGGSKNLKAATAYLDKLSTERTTLKANALAHGLPLSRKEIDQKIDRELAPFTIPMAKLISIVGSEGGSGRLSKRLKEMNFQ